MEKIFGDPKVRFSVLPVDIKQMILSSLLVDPLKAFEIVKRCENGELGKLICNNRLLFETLWKRYINKNIDKKYDKMVLSDFKNVFKNKIELYQENAYSISKTQDYIDKNKKKTNIIYNNVKNIIKIALLISNEPYDILKLKILLDKLTYIDQLFCKSQNLLTMACKKNDYDAVKLLINKGANVNIVLYEYTPLIYACYNKNYKIIKLLIQNGANIDYKPKNDNNPALLYAISMNLTEIYNFLINNGANIFIKNNKDQTSLMLACNINKLNLVKYLINNGLDINDVDNRGQQVLFYSLGLKSPVIFNYLLEIGADINHYNNEGRNPLLVAIFFGSYEMVKILINKGSYLYDKKGVSASVYSTNPKITKLIEDKISEQTFYKKYFSWW